MFETSAMQVRFVDDDDQLRAANSELLELAGFETLAFSDAESALAGIDAGFPGIFVSDIRMPRIDGRELMARVTAIDPGIPVILITGHADVPMAVSTLREGAFDFLAKPFAADHLIASVGRAIESRMLVLDNRRLREAAILAEESYPLIGETPVMRRLRDTIAEVARADFDVLIEGETGTGKELAALLLHRLGPRRGKPFMAVNCGALPEVLAENELFGTQDARNLSRPGLIVSANHGTLFLDEVDSMPLALQVKLLRALEEREVTPVGGDTAISVNLRVVAASKRDLSEAVKASVFREDLYYRLNVIRLRIPPLRERRADIPLLFAHFLKLAAEQSGRPPATLGAAARSHLLSHDWPGNARELRNFAFRTALNVSDGGSDAGQAATVPLPLRIEQFEAAQIREALTDANGDIRTALSLLGIPRKTLYDKLARHRINPAEYRPPSSVS